MITINALILKEYIQKIFQAAGCPVNDAEIISDHLVGANLRGHDSHGIIRTLGYVTGLIEKRFTAGATFEIIKETPSTAVTDGGMNLGQVAAHHGMHLAIEKATASGIGLVTVRGTGHIGRLGHYGEIACRAGMIGMAGVNVPGGQIVASYGGGHRRVATNPIMFALPTDRADAPFVLDMATSVLAEGKMKVAVNKGVTVPEGVLIDGDGKATVDPNDLYGTGDNEKRGALLPFGGLLSGYKGFGLSLAMEALGGILSGSGSAKKAVRGTNGTWLMAINIANFLDPEDWEQEVSELLEFVKEPPYAENFTEVLTAGEPERIKMDERFSSGIPVDEETWKQISEAATSVGVSPIQSF
tara:strand:+ start:994 stop:2061 length:1068 start_codon:yes stop_codon:yes gene_type:complete